MIGWPDPLSYPIDTSEQENVDESQQRATESGCGVIVLWVGVFVAGVVIGYLLGGL